MASAVPLMRTSTDLELWVFEADHQSAAETVAGWAEAGLTVRVVRGRKMREYQGLFDEFAAALQFPWYFGENGNAFHDCMTDLAWLPTQSGYTIVFRDAADVLIGARDDGLEWLISNLSQVCAEWAKSVIEGEWWDRPAVPFHVVLHCDLGEVAKVQKRWSKAGGNVVPFPEV